MGTSNFFYCNNFYTFDGLIAALDYERLCDDICEGRIIGHIYKEFEFTNAHTLGAITIAIGDDFCLSADYLSGFNSDRVTSRYADYGTHELDAITSAIRTAIYTDDELWLTIPTDEGDITETEAENTKAKCYAEAVDAVEAFIGEADRIYRELSEKFLNHNY